jgi:phosphoribosylcarboxyaminoimidazole (NCAIR) mutase
MMWVENDERVSAGDLEARVIEASGEDIAANMRRWFSFTGAQHGSIVELQALNVEERSGRGTSSWAAHASTSEDAIKLLQQAEMWSPKAPALYQILNVPDPRVASRAEPNSWYRLQRGSSTSDKDIICRTVLPIDLDVRRPSGTSTSDAELAQSVAVAAEVFESLVQQVGADAIAYGHSGNGRWLAVGLDHIAASDEVRDLVRAVLEAFAERFKHSPIKVDTALSDAKRLGPAWGTWKRKGVTSAERPHRRTGIVVPARPRRLSLDELRDLARSLEQPKQRRAEPQRSSPPEGILARGEGIFSRANRVPIADVARELGLEPRADGTVECPRGCAGGSSVVLLEEANVHKCSHDTCANVGPRGKAGVRTASDLWAEVRRVEPLRAAREILESFGLWHHEPEHTGERRIGAEPPPFEPDEYKTDDGAWPEPTGIVHAPLPPAEKPPHWFAERFRTLAETGPDWLSSPPPPQRFFLSRDGVPMCQAGIVGMLIAPGGRGKSMVLLQLAVSIATGRPWLGLVDIPHPGKVAVILAEETTDEVRRRLYRIAQSLDLTEDERRLVLERVIALGLQGEDVSLIDIAKEQVAMSELHETMRVLLAEHQCDVLLDPAVRFLPGSESDNVIANKAVRALEKLTLAAGRTLILAHHTGKDSRKNGNQGTAADARGVTGLTDSARWVANLSGETESDLKLKISKVNGVPFHEPIELSRDRMTGVVRAPSSLDRDLAKARAAALAETRRREIAAALLGLVREQPGIGKASLIKAYKTAGHKAAKDLLLEVIDELVNEDRLHMDVRDQKHCLTCVEEA